MFKETKENLLKMMQAENINLTVLVPGSNLRYVTGNDFSQSERLLLYFLDENGAEYYLVPEVEKTKLTTGREAHIFSYTDEEGPVQSLRRLKQLFHSVNNVAVESNQMRIFELEALQQMDIQKTANVMDMMKKLRIVKNAEEVDNMQKAVHILEESLQATLPFIEVGMKEVEVAAKLEYEMRIRGSEGTPFSTIVGSGYRGALPHGRASEKKIEDGDLIVIDFGAIYNGYVGDMTRTVGIGNVSDKQKHLYRVVQDAITNAVESVHLSQRIADIDAVARNTIAESGYGEYFTHRLGNGIGLDAHEEPYIASNNDDTIKPGMSFTIEPGIYIENEFGIRIEDNIVITEEGIRNLMTAINYDLIVL